MKRGLTFVIVLFYASLAHAQLLTLVKDGHHGSFQYASNFAVANNKIFFMGTDSLHGTELWISDGTDSGTHLLKDIYPGSASSFPLDDGMVVSCSNKVFFEANDGTHGYELWESDGTVPGTKILKDINPGSSSSNPERFSVYNDRVYLTANAGDAFREIWSTDGTDTGTYSLKYIHGIRYFANSTVTGYNGNIYYTATDSSAHRRTVVISNGTPVGTYTNDTLGKIVPGMYTLINNDLYFSGIDTNGVSLYKSDGTAKNTVRLKHIGSLLYPSSTIAFNGKLYFTMKGDTDGNTSQLWVSDGTAAGTKMLRNFSPLYFTYTKWNNFTVFNGKLYFSLTSLSAVNIPMYTDGTDTGTHELKGKNNFTFNSYTGAFAHFSGNHSIMFFNGQDSSQSNFCLWATNGNGRTASTFLPASNPKKTITGVYEMVEYNDAIYFPGMYADSGNFWKLDLKYLGIKTQKASVSLKTAYPNPLKGNTLHIKMQDKELATSLSITDMQGKIVSGIKLRPASDGYEAEIPEHIPNGLYIISVQTAAGACNEKLLLER